MKLMKKFMKKSEGFTLVELIVVIAILAILAGVAVPVYSGYITKAKDAAAITELDAIATAVQAANATSPTAVTQINVTAAGAIYINGDANKVAVLTPYYEVAAADIVEKLDGTSFDGGAIWYATGDNAGWNPAS